MTQYLVKIDPSQGYAFISNEDSTDVAIKCCQNRHYIYTDFVRLLDRIEFPSLNIKPVVCYVKEDQMDYLYHNYGVI